MTTNILCEYILNSYGLSVYRVSSEDTTLVIKDGNELMPVIRKSNFDVTDYIPIEKFDVVVGNESGLERRIVCLKEYLQTISNYLPDNDNTINLYNERDSVILTSSQCCVIPVSSDKTEFAVHLNYQSYDNPVVLVIIVTKDGTSTQIIQSGKQKLFFNDKGDARWFYVECFDNYHERRGERRYKKNKSFNGVNNNEKLENMIMIFQVPLKVEERLCGTNDIYNSLSVKICGMDMGMIGIGNVDEKFIGTKGLKLERDSRFPIRCTTQYYRVTDKGSITEHDVSDISKQLEKITTNSVELVSLGTNPCSNRITKSS